MLRENNQMLQAIIQASPLAIVVLDREGIVKLWNSAAETIYGWREQEVLNRPLPTVPAERQAEMQRDHQAGLAGHNFTNYETRRLRKDGTLIDVSISTAPLTDANGQTTGIVAIVADITARKRAAESLRRQHDLTTAITDSLGEGLIAVDKEGRVIFANPAAERMFGWPADELRGRVIHEVVHYKHGDGSPFPLTACPLFAAISAGQAVHSDEDFYVRRDGTLFPVAYTASPIISAGQIGGMVQAFQDITERKRVEAEREQLLQAAQAANRAKDEFLATLSHELRTPLTPIIGWIQMMNNGGIGATDVQRGLGVIDKNAQSLARLINDLLDMSAIINGKMRIDHLPVTINHVLQEALETVRPEAARRQIALELTTCATDTLLLVSGDRTRLGQVYWNLLTNAIKFSAAGGHVRVRCEADEQEVRITVEDEGEGIEPEFLPYVFERFRQADMSTTKPHGGLGIGLALVKSFVEAHGGTVRAASAGAGQGSRFIVRLPRLQLSAPASGPTHSATGAPAQPPPQQVRLLIIEDAPDTLELLRMAFARRNYHVTACDSAAAALAVAAREHFDIIISDIGLPHIDGYDLLARLRDAHHALRAVPAVALTGYAAAEDVAAAHAAGFAAHVAKPIDPATLARVVEQLLAQRAPAGET